METEHGDAIIQEGATAAPAANPNGGEAELNALREKLNILQQIQALQSQLNIGNTNTTNAQSVAPPSVAQPAMRIKPPVGSISMSRSDFRTYKKDVETYKKLSNLHESQIVLQLRLEMDIDLKRVIDANYPQWESMSLNRALEAIEHIVKETSNPAVFRKLFQETNQGKDESFQAFYTKLKALAIDCAFVCPHDEEHDLTDSRSETVFYQACMMKHYSMKF
jgi:hypothetical protein